MPNGLEVARWLRTDEDRARVRASLGVADDELLWLSVGRLEPQKDVPNLLRAFAAHARMQPRSHLVVVGDGRGRAEAESLVRELGLHERVRVLGIRDDVPDLLAASDGLVQASAWEGLPNVVMEAMAAARPVVATDVGGTSELVVDGVTGRLVPPRDAVALAGGIDELASMSRDERTRLGAAGLQRVTARHAIATVRDRWLALLDDAIGSAVGERPRAAMGAIPPVDRRG